MRVVNEPIEDRVGEGTIADHLVPYLDRELTGDQRGAVDVAVVHDLQQVAALLVVQRSEPPVVDDEQVGLGDRGEELQVPPLALGLQDLGKQAGRPPVDDVEAVAAHLLPEGAGEIGLSGSRGADDQDIVVVADPVAAGKAQHEGLVQPTGGPIVDVLDAGALLELGVAHPDLQVPALPFRHLAVDHQGQAVREREAIGLRLFHLFLERLGHSAEP